MKRPVLASLVLTSFVLSGCAISDDFIEAASQMDRPARSQSRSTAQAEKNRQDWDSYDRYRRQGPTDHAATGIR